MPARDPKSPPDFVGFDDDALLVHRENFTVAHDELAVHHHGFDVGRLTVVDPRGHDASRMREVRPQGVHDKKVCLPPDLEHAEGASLSHGSRTALRSVREDIFWLRLDARERILAPDSFGQQRNPHHLEQGVRELAAEIRQCVVN